MAQFRHVDLGTAGMYINPDHITKVVALDETGTGPSKYGWIQVVYTNGHVDLFQGFQALAVCEALGLPTSAFEEYADGDYELQGLATVAR